MARVIVADDHAILRQGLRSLISREGGLDVVAEASDGVELLEILTRVPCDLVILDLSMPRQDGMTVIKTIRTDHPAVKVLVLTMHKDAEYFRCAMARGADGYVLKDDAFEQLAEAATTVLAGRPFVSSKMKQHLNGGAACSSTREVRAGLDLLTRREREILGLVASGLANKNIADRCRISVRTVEAHRSHVMRKLRLKSTADLVRFAITQGLPPTS